MRANQAEPSPQATTSLIVFPTPFSVPFTPRASSGLRSLSGRANLAPTVTPLLSLQTTMAAMTMSMAAPATRAVAGNSKAAGSQRAAFMGRPAAGSKASVADAFSAMSLSTPKQARGLSICGAYRTNATTRIR